MMKTLLLCVTLSVFSVPSTRTEPFFREYHYVKALKTWEEAQQACRELHSDLATVDSPAESARLLGEVQEPGELAWIGLYDNMTKWKWTMGRPEFDRNIDYHCWQDDNPKYKCLNDTCATVRYNGLWRDEICNTERPFVCYNEQGPPKFIYVTTFMTWDDAKNYCRSMYTDLARVNSEAENTELYNLLPRNAWIGLYRRPGLPGLWFNVNCEEKHNFFCERLIPPRSRVKLRFRSGADLTDPQIQLQILEQLQAELQTNSLTDVRLRWITRDGQVFHEEKEEGK
ncbi:hypothetical protein OJAV_G00106130 [Oryzias javanicus]|uniref:C-type lectin domain-containing protein n=1 Tax=Oryzias javanicus TaxID=123683 RepID=A0A3S2Q0F2_ORYJA|nr:hypothetical protein OJAV_G00106130 [Oryzias javanicus]